MAVHEYQCGHCGNKFTVQRDPSAETEPAMKCSSCGSTDVRDQGPHAGITEFLRRRVHFN
ncbi:MAG: hypothetical protein A2Y91_04020 [Chloroflexi bacterium RBG_13_54_8]|nr:MAG: hypothetical protein A2Y91_04020 [Chloroflexi bacterium RBG_13_54_8]